jgi:hypothetical protein
MSLNIAAGLGLGGNESYPDLFQPYGGFPDGVRVENGTSPCRICRALRSIKVPARLKRVRVGSPWGRRLRRCWVRFALGKAAALDPSLILRFARSADRG